MTEPKIADLLISSETLFTQAYRRGVTYGIALAREKAIRALAEPIEGEEGESPPVCADRRRSAARHRRAAAVPQPQPLCETSGRLTWDLPHDAKLGKCPENLGGSQRLYRCDDASLRRAIRRGRAGAAGVRNRLDRSTRPFWHR
jgi:hypothetical protein